VSYWSDVFIERGSFYSLMQKRDPEKIRRIIGLKVYTSSINLFSVLEKRIVKKDVSGII
jgi:multisubunit Na+/H+ antiporter MnhC subunit